VCGVRSSGRMDLRERGVPLGLTGEGERTPRRAVAACQEGDTLVMPDRVQLIEEVAHVAAGPAPDALRGDCGTDPLTAQMRPSGAPTMVQCPNRGALSSCTWVHALARTLWERRALEARLARVQLAVLTPSGRGQIDLT